MSDQIQSAATLMVRDYLVLAFLVSLGALQIAVSISGIRGLWLTPNRVVTQSVGVLLIAVGIGFYIFSPLWVDGPWAAGSVVDGTSADRLWGTAALEEISAARNVNDVHGGMAGTAYAVFFVLAAVMATIFAAVVGALNVRILNPSSSRRGLGGGRNETPGGLDTLKQTDAISTLSESLRVLHRTGRADVNEYMLAAHRWSIPSIVRRMWRN